MIDLNYEQHYTRCFNLEIRSTSVSPDEEKLAALMPLYDQATKEWRELSEQAEAAYCRWLTLDARKRNLERKIAEWKSYND